MPPKLRKGSKKNDDDSYEEKESSSVEDDLTNSSQSSSGGRGTRKLTRVQRKSSRSQRKASRSRRKASQCQKKNGTDEEVETNSNTDRMPKSNQKSSSRRGRKKSCRSQKRTGSEEDEEKNIDEESISIVNNRKSNDRNKRKSDAGQKEKSSDNASKRRKSGKKDEETKQIQEGTKRQGTTRDRSNQTKKRKEGREISDKIKSGELQECNLTAHQQKCYDAIKKQDINNLNSRTRKKERRKNDPEYAERTTEANRISSQNYRKKKNKPEDKKKEAARKRRSRAKQKEEEARKKKEEGAAKETEEGIEAQINLTPRSTGGEPTTQSKKQNCDGEDTATPTTLGNNVDQLPKTTRVESVVQSQEMRHSGDDSAFLNQNQVDEPPKDTGEEQHNVEMVDVPQGQENQVDPPPKELEKQVVAQNDEQQGVGGKVHVPHDRDNQADPPRKEPEEQLVIQNNEQQRNGEKVDTNQHQGNQVDPPPKEVEEQLVVQNDEQQLGDVEMVGVPHDRDNQADPLPKEPEGQLVVRNDEQQRNGEIIEASQALEDEELIEHEYCAKRDLNKVVISYYNEETKTTSFYNLKDNVGKGDCFFESVLHAAPDLCDGVEWLSNTNRYKRWHYKIKNFRQELGQRLLYKCFGYETKPTRTDNDRDKTKGDRNFKILLLGIFDYCFGDDFEGTKLSDDEKIYELAALIQRQQFFADSSWAILFSLLLNIDVEVFSIVTKTRISYYQNVKSTLEQANLTLPVNMRVVEIFHHHGGYPLDTFETTSLVGPPEHFVAMIKIDTVPPKKVIFDFPWTYDYTKDVVDNHCSTYSELVFHYLCNKTRREDIPVFPLKEAMGKDQQYYIDAGKKLAEQEVVVQQLTDAQLRSEKISSRILSKNVERIPEDGSTVPEQQIDQDVRTGDSNAVRNSKKPTIQTVVLKSGKGLQFDEIDTELYFSEEYFATQTQSSPYRSYTPTWRTHIKGCGCGSSKQLHFEYDSSSALSLYTLESLQRKKVIIVSSNIVPKNHQEYEAAILRSEKYLHCIQKSDEVGYFKRSDKAYAARCVLQYVPNGFALIVGKLMDMQRLQLIFRNTRNGALHANRQLAHDHFDDLIIATIKQSLLQLPQGRFSIGANVNILSENFHWDRFDDDTCVLLGVKGSKIDFPGGKRELGETTEECVVRETFEETSLNLSEHVIRDDSNDFRETVNLYMCYICSSRP